MDSPSPSHLAAQCSICGTLLSGAMSVVFRTVGIRRSPRNPNLCTRCGTHVDEGRVIEITVLFADLSSFTEMTQDLGPDRTHEVVDAFLRMATDVLVRHGAFIDKYVGDAVMALFNVPIRQGDHARRAVFAATELTSELQSLSRRFGLPLEASIGVATGWARVGRLGSEDNKDYTAIGDVVNLAARLQGKANAGEILISDASYIKHSSDFPGATAERFALKGFREPVRAYRLHGKADTRPADEPHETAIKKGASLGAIIFGILGAPCAVSTLIGPLAVAFGAGGFFGLSAALVFLDRSAIRVPILVLTTAVALANLYTVWHARKLRTQEQISAHLKVMTTLEKRRTLFVLAASVATLGIVGFEIVAHIMLH
ncbi:MAG TPA: adenylate/guanylate cyclase domain-containing protein [Candidatus Udaeobacter sp.]|nr:adenylate/guanylate cyclase domain-containing protein [Candidatus Udaeobacter sp.]